ncbi:MAG: hypothetical protein KDK78_03020 [Chlamydiia bacterium]|nr:hypothetical protein [Chlamydiia bacterium]
MWPLIGIDQGALFATPAGLGYRDRSYELFIPWAHISHGSCSMEAEKGFYCALRSDAPVRAYELRRMPKGAQNHELEPPFCIAKRAVHIPVLLQDEAGEVESVLNRLQDAYEWEVASKLSSPLTGGRATAVEERLHTLVLDSDHVHFPSFCPFTGKDCDTVMNVPIEGEEATQRWLCSREALSQKDRIRRLRHGTCLGASWLYMLLVYICADASVHWSENISPILYCLAVYAVIPVVWHRTRAGLRLRRTKEGGLECFCKDVDYFRALADLNLPAFVPLSWRADADTSQWTV